jgi:hypothetical protein
MKARYLVNKAKRLEKRLHDLQFDLYSFQNELDEVGLTGHAEQARDAAFELDASHYGIKDLWQDIEAAYCRKITAP